MTLTFRREHQIKATDKEIDDLVHRLYGLNDHEIRMLLQADRHLKG